MTAYLQTCPRSKPPGGPFHAPQFARLAHAKVRHAFNGAQTIDSQGGDPAVARAIDPVAGGGDGCVSTAAEKAPGTARYALKAGRSFTLVGAPQIRARLTVSGAPPADAQIAARLWDVAPGGSSQRLVARGLYRPSGGRNAWQLHPAAWRFRRDHTPVLELLGSDAPYARPSNESFEIEVRGLRIVLPAR